MPLIQFSKFHLPLNQDTRRTLSELLPFSPMWPVAVNGEQALDCNCLLAFDQLVSSQAQPFKHVYDFGMVNFGRIDNNAFIDCYCRNR